MRGTRMRSKRIEGGTARGIAASVEMRIRDGSLEPGDHLPTIRGLAEDLGVSPVTVASAYRDLRRRGLIVAAGRRGTRVAARPPLVVPREPSVPSEARDLATGNPDPALLPSLAGALSSVDPHPVLYEPARKSEELVTLAAHQFEADGIAVPALAVVGGALDGIERVLAAHLAPGDAVAVEDPGFIRVFDLLRGSGYELAPMRVDDFGPAPAELDRALRRGARAVVLTPRAQNPMGSALHERRARQLRTILRTHPHVIVVEDDHAGPVAGTPTHSICGSGREAWAVVRSVSKTLGPDLRLAVVAGDEGTIARVEGRQSLGTGWVSSILQQLVVALCSDAGTVRGLTHATRTYTERRTALITSLNARGIEGHGRSGFNVWIPVPEETAVAGTLLRRGWAVTPGERWRLGTPPAIRVTTSTLLPEEAERFADDLAEALQRTGSSFA